MASGSETSGFEEEREPEGDSDFELERDSPAGDADYSDDDGRRVKYLFVPDCLVDLRLVATCIIWID